MPTPFRVTRRGAVAAPHSVLVCSTLWGARVLAAHVFAARVVSALVLASLVLGCGCDEQKSAQASSAQASSAQASPQAAATRPGAPTATTAPTPPSAASPDGNPADSADSSQAPATKPNATKPTKDDAIPSDVPRVYGLSRHVWVRSMPTSEVQWIGFLWLGSAVPIRQDEQPKSGAGCSQPWIPVEPRGWVCVDDEQATTNPEHPALQALWPYRPRVDSPWPHRYAEVHAPLTRYDDLPDEKIQSLREVGYESHIAKVRTARESGSIEAFPDYLGALDPSLSGKAPPKFPRTEDGLLDLPQGLSEGRTKVVGRSALAYSAEADHGDRAFLLASDMSWVPKDRVELLERSEFRGLELEGSVRLPLAFFRGKTRPGYRRLADGSFEEVPNKFPKYSHVLLEKDRIVREGYTRYYKVVGQDLWVSSKQAVVPTPRSKTPWGAPIGQPDETGLARPGRATWLEASILGGWLVAFEGTKPVYVTMISAGRGGTPHPGKDPLETASTPTGWFPIGGKFRTATMDSSTTPIVHADVPWTQNFSGPHALHSAYWHDDFGNLKSAGCVNVSPRDGQWLFDFTEPSVPDEWHGVRYVARYGGGSTLFIIHE